MAISVTVAATSITVTATDVGGNTIDDIYVAVAASAYPSLMVRTGASAPYTYTLPAQTYLNISSDSWIKDYTSGGGTIQWDSRTASATTMFRVQYDCRFELGPDWVMDFDTSNTYYTYVYFYGQAVLQGTSGHEVYLKHYYNCYFYSYASSGQNTGGCDFDWVIIEDMPYGNGYWIYLPASMCYTARPSHSFSNVTIRNTPAIARGSILIRGSIDCTELEFDNITMDGVYSAMMIDGAAVKFSNSSFTNCSYIPLQLNGSGSGVGRYEIAASPSDAYNVTRMQQPKTVFDTCVFKDNYGANEYTAGVNYGGLVKFKDCTCEEVGSPPGNQGFMCQGMGACLHQGTHTFTNITNKYYRNGGSHFEVKVLTLNVTDSGGSPIEGATVTIQEVNGYNGLGETLITRNTGYIKDLFGDDPVLVYREITDNAGTTFTNWGDYTITVSKPGYTIDTRTVDMSSDQNITVALTTNAVGVTTLIDSTIYDSTIY